MTLLCKKWLMQSKVYKYINKVYVIILCYHPKYSLVAFMIKFFNRILINKKRPESNKFDSGLFGAEGGI